MDHRLVGLALLALAVGCNAGPEMRSQVHVSGDRSTVLYERHAGEWVAVRNGVRHTFEVGSGCFSKSPYGVHLSGDGRLAIVEAWDVTLPDPFPRPTWDNQAHSTATTTMACELDLETEAIRDLKDAHPKLAQTREGSEGWMIGSRTGWFYRTAVGLKPEVHDGKGSSADFEFTASGCDLVERVDAIIVACAEWDRDQLVAIRRFDPTAFPPKLISSSVVDVPAETVRLSRDGNQLVWWGGRFGESLGGVIDTAAGRQLGWFAGQHIWGADFNADGTELAVLQNNYKREAVVRRLSLTTTGDHDLEQIELHDIDVVDVFWLADGAIVVSGHADSRRLTPSS